MQVATNHDDLLTVDELAALLKIPKATLYSWRYISYGPPSIKVGRYLRYRNTEVTRWIAEQTAR